MTEKSTMNNSYNQDDDYKLLEQFDGYFECARDITENNQRQSSGSSRRTWFFFDVRFNDASARSITSVANLGELY